MRGQVIPRGSQGKEIERALSQESRVNVREETLHIWSSTSPARDLCIDKCPAAPFPGIFEGRVCSLVSVWGVYNSMFIPKIQSRLNTEATLWDIRT